mmetsp:Transcript_24085/g.23994  ORF Transcript_24085/g.23994 Transcript_24085/m.23994 type:complete len:103 (-) Transcript_24085:60-368(-)
MAQFFSLLSASLKIDVSQQIFYSVAKNNSIIQDLVRITLDEYTKTLFMLDNLAEKEKAINKKEREIILEFVKYLTVELKNPEDIIIAQDSRSQEMYFIANGV